MSGRWGGSSRRARLPTDWSRRRAVVLARDGYLCQIRGPRCIRIASDVDHVRASGSDELGNLQAACKPCHRSKSSQEGNEAKPTRRRPPPAHPGRVT